MKLQKQELFFLGSSCLFYSHILLWASKKPKAMCVIIIEDIYSSRLKFSSISLENINPIIIVTMVMMLITSWERNYISPEHLWVMCQLDIIQR